MARTAAELEERIRSLESQLNESRDELARLRHHNSAVPQASNWQWPLLPEEYTRYGRQLITSEIGIRGQSRLKQASMAVIGAGGLGCPASIYLAGAGIGTIGLIDGDIVELSNLHRQIMHTTANIGQFKVNSLRASIQALNPNVRVKCFPGHLSASNATAILAGYDVVLDCTDSPKSRYLISDAAVLLGIPLVSASALRTDGQLMVLNHPARPPGHKDGGPCYRCIFPRPPPPETVVACGEGGILGPVVGVMGVLQALEAIKVLVSEPELSSNKEQSNGASVSPTLLTFSALASPQFRSVRLRPRRRFCETCSSKATITSQVLKSGSLDYEALCGLSKPTKLLSADERISPEEIVNSETDPSHSPALRNHVLVDIREKPRFELFNLSPSTNVPFSDLNLESVDHLNSLLDTSTHREQANPSLLLICDRGNDSQLVVKKLKHHLATNGRQFSGQIRDVRGGWDAVRRLSKSQWPDI